MRHAVILLAEDDLASRILTQFALESTGHTLLLAETGRESIQQLDQNPDVELVLLDLNMPDGSGLEVLTHIRETPRMADLPVVIVTTSESARDREATAELGADDYIVKSPDHQVFTEELLGAIDRALA